MVILITGKKGSGKSHYAKLLQEELVQEHYQVKWLDGDAFRKETGNADYTDEGRLRNLMDAAEIARAYEMKGWIVLLSFIMPQKRYRDKMRNRLATSRIVYIPGGTLWVGTKYERPTEREMKVKYIQGF